MEPRVRVGGGFPGFDWGLSPSLDLFWAQLSPLFRPCRSNMPVMPSRRRIAVIEQLC